MSTSKIKQKRVPKLRFPEFKTLWDIKKLSDIATIQRGRFSPRPRNNPKYYGGDIPFVQTGDVVKSGGVIKQYTQTLNAEGLKVSKLFPKGTVLMTIAANIGYTGILDIDMACPDSLIGLTPKENISNTFLNFFFTTQREYMDRIASQAAQKNINIDFLKPFPVTLPPFAEQQKIADILNSVDTLLENLRVQKQSLENYKQGLMQKLFTHHVRFKDAGGKNFPNWEEKRLEEVLSYKQPTEFIVESTEYSDEYTVPVLTAGKSFILGYTNETKGIFNYELPVIIFDDFTTATQFVDFKFKVKSSAMKILVPINGNNIKFIYEAIQCIQFEVGGHGRHWISKYSKISIDTPCLQEQEKIANLATALDQTIFAKEEEILKTEEWKRGLMQKMFI